MSQLLARDRLCFVSRSRGEFRLSSTRHQSPENRHQFPPSRRDCAAPILADNPLLKARNCLITPHIAWATEEARTRLMEATVKNVESFLAGKPINLVN